MEKILIIVRGGVIQNIISTNKDVELYVADFDNRDPNNKDAIWQYWKGEPDAVFNKQQIETKIEELSNE